MERSDDDPPPALAETHISWVVLRGDRALKILKPVRSDFLDHSTVSSRRHACMREVELNRRIAPDVYRGVAQIMLDGTTVEPVIVMDRMPAGRRLSCLLDGSDAADLVTAVARRVAAFHGEVDVVTGAAAEAVAGLDAVRHRWHDDLAACRDQAGDLLEPSTLDEIDRLSSEYIAGRGPLFASRIADGMIRDGHGDLLADDIFCLDDGPRILDCLAFSDELRRVDVLADTGFLVMDLERLGHPDLAARFLATYVEFTAEHHPQSLAHLHIAQRALVRAKVGAIRHAQDTAAGLDAPRFLDQSLGHLQHAEVRVVLIGGIPGSGKSTLAAAVADEVGWAVISSDDVRRDLGRRAVDRPDRDAVAAYQPQALAAVYDELLRRAAVLVSHGQSVILDATWSQKAERDLAARLAVDGRARLVPVLCDAPITVCQERVARRRPGESESEATPAVVEAAARHLDPWPDAVVADTTRVLSGSELRRLAGADVVRDLPDGGASP